MRKLGVDNKHRRSMLANLAISLIMNEKIETTEARAKEARRVVEKMITYGKNGSLVSRRKAAAFLMNNKEATKKVFEELAPKYATRNGGYTRIIKLKDGKVIDDSNPYNGAYSFNDYSECIDLIARVFIKYYINPAGTKIYDGTIASGKYYS